jgi:hypothetical protein
MNKQIDQALQREVTRKEFITLAGFAAASLMGIGSIIKLLTGKSVSNVLPRKHTTEGYGISPYGGLKEG